MKKKFTDKATIETLDLADIQLNKSKLLARITTFTTLPLIAGAVAGFFYFEPKWYEDVFLSTILAFFVLGQLIAFFQFNNIIKGAKSVKKLLNILLHSENITDLEHLDKEVMKSAPAGHLRNIILRWLSLGLQGEYEGFEAMMENAALRRARSTDKQIAIHNIINRVTLKLGFLGTLIGLIMTFPPMKSAILSLQGSGGEFKFVTDIASAIDGDQYAILTTLFATALSIFIELMTIQVFERVLNGFEVVNNYVDEWNITTLQPIIKKYYTNKNKTEDILEVEKLYQKKLIEIQELANRQINELKNVVLSTSKQIANLTEIQKIQSERIQKVVSFENQYRSFLDTKQKSVMDETLIPNNLESGI